ncbi:hypothetical protein XELAEV_18002960mg [Xenopus laevis]|nr:hypothetical protein XELAEV_18002960mg [Xenopus laevis]
MHCIRYGLNYLETCYPETCGYRKTILFMQSIIVFKKDILFICINETVACSCIKSILTEKQSLWIQFIQCFVFQVNVLALSICTRAAYQSMKERNIDDGHIININSMSGHRVLPTTVMHFYSATKYAVTALTEGLRQELREERSHIRATSISPGLVETGFAFKLLDNDPEKAAATYESIKCLKAEDIASTVVYVLSAPPHVQIGDIQLRPTEQIS